jgi:hypothetical protein
MNNVIADLPGLVSEQAMNTPTPHALKTGSSHAGAIFNAFTDDSGESAKTALMRSLAVDKKLTYQEFEDQCKDAQKLADNVDQAAGFVPEKGTKDINKRYGIKRRVLNQRLSEAKRLFGVFKQAPEVLEKKGYQAALVAARAWLDENKVQWDGAPKLDKEEKEAKEEKDAVGLARTTAMINNPQKDGEDLPAYLERITSVVEQAGEQARAELFVSKVDKLAASLAKTYDADVLIAACLRILESGGDLAGTINYLQDALTIKALTA